MFSKGVSWGWNLDSRWVWGVERKKFFQARYRSPWPPCKLQHTFTFYPAPVTVSGPLAAGPGSRAAYIPARHALCVRLQVMTSCGSCYTMKLVGQVFNRFSTSVSETTRKPSLAEAQTASGKQKNRPLLSARTHSYLSHHTIRCDIEYLTLTCSKKLTCSQLSSPHGTSRTRT